MQDRPKDLRVVKTLDAIHAAFSALLLEKKYSQITVKELCARARINKKTFYRYYPAIEYLLAEMQNQYTAAYLERIKGLSFPQDEEKITRAFLEFSSQQDELYESITRIGPHSAIRDEMVANVEREGGVEAEPPDGWDAGVWELYLAYVTSAPLRIYQAWLEGGKKLSSSQMVEVGCALVAKGGWAIRSAKGRIE